MGRRRHRGLLALIALALVPLAVAATAFACARLATLKLDRTAGKAGKTVTVTGRNFNANPAASTVQVRFNSRRGDVLWEGRPDAKGKVVGTFSVPDARPGYYVVVATQQLANGAPAAGTPGRASLKVKKAKKKSQAVAAAPLGAPSAGGPSGPVVLALTTGLLGLLGGGAWLAASGLRRARRRLPATTA